MAKDKTIAYGGMLLEGDGIKFAYTMRADGGATLEVNGRKIELSPRGSEIGHIMPAGHPHEGWIYAGISETTQQPFYVAANDSGVFEWKEALAFAARGGSRLPSKEELNQIYLARDKGAFKASFDETGSLPDGWYWSSSVYDDSGAWAQRFSDGLPYYGRRHRASSLRCVR